MAKGGDGGAPDKGNGGDGSSGAPGKNGTYSSRNGGGTYAGGGGGGAAGGVGGTTRGGTGGAGGGTGGGAGGAGGTDAAHPNGDAGSNGFEIGNTGVGGGGGGGGGGFNGYFGPGIATSTSTGLASGAAIVGGNGGAGGTGAGNSNSGQLSGGGGGGGGGYGAIASASTGTIVIGRSIKGGYGGAGGGSTLGAYGSGGDGGVGLDLTGAAAQVTNNEFVTGGTGGPSSASTGFGGAGGIGIAFANTGKGAYLDNAGTVRGGTGGAAYYGGAGGAGVTMSGTYAKLTNEANREIYGGSGGSGASYSADGGAGVDFKADYAELSNKSGGTISGGAALGTSYRSAGGAGVRMVGSYVSATNAGAITGGTGFNGSSAGAGVYFGGGTATLDNQTGGTVTGGIAENGGDGASFAHSNGTVTNAGTIQGGIGQGGIGGNGVTFSGSYSSATNNAAQSILGGDGSAGGPGDAVGASGGIGIAFTSVNAASLSASPAAVTAAPPGAGGAVYNHGRVAGGGGYQGVAGGKGGAGVSFSRSYSLLNNYSGGTITGGNAGNGTDGTGGYGGAGVSFSGTNSMLENDSGGTITGGTGGASTSGEGGTGGFGVLEDSSGFTLKNDAGGTITGGAGGRSNGDLGGVGGEGVALGGGSILNSGTIQGGAGGTGPNVFSDGFGGAGIDGLNVTVVNAGTIAGGLRGGSTSRYADAIDFYGSSNTLAIGSSATFTGDLFVNIGATLTFDQSAGAGVTGVGTDATLSAPIVGNGAIVKVGAGTLTLSSSTSTFSGGTTIEAGTLDLTAFTPVSNGMPVQGSAGTGAISFEASAGNIATLALDMNAQPPQYMPPDQGVPFGNTLDDFGDNDRLDLKGFAYEGASPFTVLTPNGNILSVTENGETESFTLGGTQQALYYARSDGNGGTLVNDSPVCFASGTLIRTVRGDVVVETLAVGDRVVTASGEHRSIRWLGHRTIDCRRHADPQAVWPVRIAAHAFGANKPARDLYVSPGHSICLDILGEVLIPAAALVNGATVQQVEGDAVTYWHVELDSHDVILAENLPAESYLDMGNRDFFAEGDVVRLDMSPDARPVGVTHAEFCRPYHDGGPLIEAVRAQMRARALALGWRLSDELDVHLEVDGTRVDPVIRGQTLRFLVPAEAKDVAIVSATARPYDTTGAWDVRDLGIDLAALRIEDGFGPPREVAVDDPLLDVGFFDVEAGGHRWTEGRARLPADLWAGCAETFFLRLDLCGPPVARWVALEGNEEHGRVVKLSKRHDAA